MSVPATQMSFDERLMAKIKDSIGDLMTPEDLKKIVERGIEEALFKGRVTRREYSREEIEPSLVQKAIEKYCDTHVRTAVDAWLAANQDKVLPLINQVINDGISKAVLAALDAKLSYDFQQLGNTVVERLRGR